jgi:hypothetical protein
MSVRLAIIWRATGHTSLSGPLEAIPKHTNPKSTPDKDAMIMRFVFCIDTSYINNFDSLNLTGRII